MDTNVGLLDRVARITVGLALIIFALGIFPGYQSAWGWIGLMPLATGIVGSCPLYSIFGLRTCTG